MTRTSTAFLLELEQIIAERARAPLDKSYTASLMASGVRRIAQKVGEEGVEVALAAVGEEPAELLEESADLLFHLLVLLHERGFELGDVTDVLAERHARRR